MGLLSVGIGPDAQRDMTKIEPEMLLAIHYATETIQAGNFDSKLWFGDCSSGWINGLKKRGCKPNCVNTLLDMRSNLLLKFDYKPIQSWFPISNWHGPFFRCCLNCQVDNFEGGGIIWKHLSRFN